MDKEKMAYFLFIVLQRLGNAIASDLHYDFTSQELAHTFGADSYDQVPMYTTTNVRGPLKLQDQGAPSHLSFDAFRKTIFFNVSQNEDLNPQSHVTEFVDANGNIKKVLGMQGEFSYGTVLDDPLSRVALHHSGRGLSGTIRTYDELYIIAPLPHRFKEEKVRDHIIYRASDNPDDRYIKKVEATEQEVNDIIATHKRASRKRRAVAKKLPKKTVELLVAGDSTMVKFYGKDFLPTFLLTTINLLHGMLSDPTMLYPVNLAVVRTQIFETDIFKAKDLHDLLSKFEVWCDKQNNLDDKSPEHFDTGLVITRDGCSEGCGEVGLGNEGQSCHPLRSHAAAVDKGFMTSIILAHELGHILGAAHDGNKRCPAAVNIMGPAGNYGGINALRYSICSQEAIAETMRNPKKSSCFDDAPPKNLLDKVNNVVLYGTIYNADKQCQFDYGPDFQRCIYENNHCNALYCNKKGTKSCDTRFFPALHGTHCGPGKWCIEAKCVPNGHLLLMSAPKHKINGGWSAWSDFTKCNKPCNGGMRWKTRLCNSPKPINGGRLCLGLDRKNKEGEQKGHFETCNEQPCPGGKKFADTWLPERNEQCEKRGGKGKTFCTACGVIDTDPCGLYCGLKDHGIHNYGKMGNGAYCKKMNRPGMCVNGECQTIGCDNKLHSGNRLDRCDVCGGDGSTCEILKKSDPAYYCLLKPKSYYCVKYKVGWGPGKWGSFYVATIPAGASRIKIEEGGKGTNDPILIKIGSKTSNYLWGWAYKYDKKVAGVQIHFRIRRGKDLITVTGTLTEPLHIYFAPYYHYYDTKMPNQPIEWTYRMGGKEPSKTPVPADWQIGEFGACSKTCAGGIKRRIIECKRKDDNSPTGLDACRKVNGKEPEATQKCNTQDCPGTWDITEWTKCSKSCATGSQSRKIRCMAVGVQGLHVVEDSNCKEDKPKVEVKRTCNAVSCPPKWDCFKNKKVCTRIDHDSKFLVEPDLECLAIHARAESVHCDNIPGEGKE